LSSPPNPIPELPQIIDATPPLVTPPPPEPLPTSVENPVWTGWDVAALAVVTVAIIVFFSLTLALAEMLLWFGKLSFTEVAALPVVIVPAQIVAYAVVILIMHRIAGRSGNSALSELHWNWPQAWAAYVLGGLALAIALQGLAQLLPMPKNLPIDEFFKTKLEAYLLSIFGITFAPLLEELYFRGFMYPVVDRWLYEILSSPRRTRISRTLLLLAAAWGYALHWLPNLGQILVASVLGVAAGALFLARITGEQHSVGDRFVLPVAGFAAWSAVAHAVHGRGLFAVTGVLLLVGLALTVILARRPGPQRVPLLGIVGAVGITAFGFALIHGAQLTYSWGPVLVIFLVGVTFTAVRAIKKSVAATLLMHMAYNGTITVALFFATDHFRHLERMNR
jgi:membrane protease YdiL (CAAX protease family)